MSTFQTPILLYHHVEGEPPSAPSRFPGNYVSLAEFRGQLDDLVRRGLRTLTMSQAAASRGSGTIALTFDDGCDCFHRWVMPELEARGMTATVFAVADLLGDHNRWDVAAGGRRERLMDGGELRRLADSGIEIGCHSATHPDLTTIDSVQLGAEVAGARARLKEALGSPPAVFCYPYGRFDGASRTAVESAGFATAVSVWGYPGASRRDRLALPRAGIDPGESPSGFRLKGSAAYPWFRRLPRLGVLDALRRRTASEGAS